MKTTGQYKSLIIPCGIVTLLLVLEYYEEQENYEECFKIIEAIELFQLQTDIELPKRLNDSVIADVLGEFKKFGLTGKGAMTKYIELSEKIIYGII